MESDGGEYVGAGASTVIRASALTLALCLAILPAASAQEATDQTSAALAKDQSPNAPTLGHVPAQSDDVIGPDDSVTISVLESDEISKTWRVNGSGDVELPLVGRLHAAGLTADQLSKQLTEGLRKYIREPHVTVYIAEFRSQPVTVTGAVHRPGTFQTEGPKTLWTVLTMAGGLEKSYGATVTVTRQVRYGLIPLPGAQLDGDGTHSVIVLQVKDVEDASSASSNLLIRPNDTVAVSTDERRVYIIGEVAKPGMVELVTHDSISLMEVLAAAGGLTKNASAGGTEIMRQNSKGLYERVGSIDLKKLQHGKTEDRMLSAGDIVVVPTSGIKAYTQIASAGAIATGFTMLTLLRY